MRLLALKPLATSQPTNLQPLLAREGSEQRAGCGPLPADLLSHDQRTETDRLAAEGYRFYSEETLEFAQASAKAVAEALGDDWASP